MRTSSHRWLGFFGLAWFLKGLKAGVFQSVLIFLKSSPKECVFSLVHPIQHTHSSLQRWTCTLILLTEIRMKITEKHFVLILFQGAFKLLVALLLMGTAPLHMSYLPVWPGRKKKRLKVTVGHSLKCSTHLGIHPGKYTLGDGEKPQVVYPSYS